MKMNVLILLTVIGSFTVISGKDLYKCPAGWLQFKSTCYIFSRYFVEWKWARYDCQHRNGSLAVIKNQEEQSFLMDAMPYQVRYWIGLRRTPKDKTFRWMDGSELFGYTNWKLGEPNDIHDDEYCVHMYNKQLLGQWNDNYCREKLLFICQKEASPQS